MSQQSYIKRLAAHFTKTVLTVFALIAITASTNIFTSPRLVKAADSSLSCIKFEGSNLGQSGVSGTIGSYIFTIISWIPKVDSSNEYIGFNYTVGNYTSGTLTYLVKASTETFGPYTAEASGSWTSPEGNLGPNAHAVSHIEICLAAVSTPTPTPTTDPVENTLPTPTATPTQTPTVAPTREAQVDPGITVTPTSAPRDPQDNGVGNTGEGSNGVIITTPTPSTATTTPTTTATPKLRVLPNTGVSIMWIISIAVLFTVGLSVAIYDSLKKRTKSK